MFLSYVFHMGMGDKIWSPSYDTHIETTRQSTFAYQQQQTEQ
jgi:hypothetical protein